MARHPWRFGTHGNIATTVALAAVASRGLLAQTPRPRPLPPIEVTEASITDLQQAMSVSRVTSTELVGKYLARIAAYDRRGPELNTMIRINPSARAEARARDAERQQGKIRGPLHGVPIILKDNFDTADEPTSGGSAALANHQPRQDAFVVRRLREAGAVIIGKSNMHELAAGITTISSLGGQTHNPYDPRRCPGGSSGGTGAAIAASFAAVGWGSDTCGSIRIPSAFASLVGLRPTVGLFSRTGVMPLSHTQDVPGPLARTVMDLAIALDATIGPDPDDSVTLVMQGRPLPHFVDSLSAESLRGARIGILMPYFADADGEIIDTVRAAIRAMTAAGADTVRVALPSLDSLLGGTSVINYEHKYDIIDYLARTPGETIASIADIIASGMQVDVLEARYRLADSVGTRGSDAYRRALARQRTNRALIVALMDSLKVDALVYPTMRRKPVLVGDPQLGTTCALSAQTGLPALSMPAGFTGDGLPVGIELLGRPFTDARLVSMAFAFEKLGPRRRAPFSTPPLVNGRAPLPVAIVASVQTTAATARGQFTYDRTRGTLQFNVTVIGTGATGVQSVLLRRRSSDGRARVVYRLAGPGVTSSTGSFVLNPIDRTALFAGQLVLTVVPGSGAIADARLSPPKS